MLSNISTLSLIAGLRTNLLAKEELRQIREGVYVSLKQSPPEGHEYAFCLSSGDRMYFFFMKRADNSVQSARSMPIACFRAPSAMLFNSLWM
jgi:hypothetical protein